MTNPRMLAKVLAELPEAVVRAAELEAWQELPATLILKAELLQNLQNIWAGMLESRSWEEFLEYRGQYKSLSLLLDMENLIGTADRSSPPEVLAELFQRIKEAEYGPARNPGNPDGTE